VPRPVAVQRRRSVTLASAIKHICILAHMDVDTYECRRTLRPHTTDKTEGSF
jgi:hypothetical protein